MAKAASHIIPLPPGLMPAQSSTCLIKAHLERMRARGIPQKVIAFALDAEPSYVSMLKKGEELPLPRVTAFTAGARLSEEEGRELRHARVMELHGRKGEICVEALAQWAFDLVAPVGDEARAVELWRDAISPAPHLLAGLLADPARAARLGALMHELVQAELKAMADGAAMP